jgi:hypothetical protein
MIYSDSPFVILYSSRCWLTFLQYLSIQFCWSVHSLPQYANYSDEKASRSAHVVLSPGYFSNWNIFTHRYLVEQAQLSFVQNEWTLQKNWMERYCNTYWNTKLQLDCQSKSSLSLLSTTSLEMGKTHIVWDLINNSVRDVRQAITKARMLTGTYMLQPLKSKFNQSEVDPTCT